MPALSSVTRPFPVTVRVPIGDGEVVELVYDQNAMTRGWVKRLGSETGVGAVEALSAALIEILLSWDIVNDDGTPTPITAEVLADLPLAFLRRVDEAIELTMPGSEEGNASRTTSSTHTSDSSRTPVSPPNGQEPSQSPKPSDVPSVT